MQQFLLISSIFLWICSFSSSVLAGPWFTGPLLAPAGHTIPKGHTNVEVYGLDVETTGRFDASGHLIHTPLFRSLVANPIISHGLTDWMDVQFIVPYVYNHTRNVSSHRLADVSAVVGLQVLEQKESKWKPNLRFAITETFPTGRFEYLNPDLAGTDATGLGSYETQLALNFQLLHEVLPGHYLRTRLSLTRLYSSRVRVHGLNSYGGAVDTSGTIATGTENDADLAFEFTLDKHWVAVMEGYISEGQSTRFDGILSIGNIGGPTVTIGSDRFYEEALAPALEYNFNENIGLIGGLWFPITGKNTSNYMAFILALNAFW
ncbi:MAG: hypothetical protein EPN84_05330 [Legionella sp.]|nr:MAG: hypothetical protein EPN84_05330 [Legionella sp.]